MNKIFLEDLPRDKRNRIIWLNISNYKVKFIYEGIEEWIEIKCYNKDTGKLTIVYNKKEFKMVPEMIKKCNFGNIVGKRTKEFKIELLTNYKDYKRDITIIDRKKEEDSKGQEWKFYKYKCNRCGFSGDGHYKNQEYREELWILESNLLTQENGCACCSGDIVVEGINDIPTTAPWMIKYFQGGYDEAKLYTKTSNKSIIPICPDCKKIKSKSMAINNICNRHSMGCEYCGDSISYPNKFAYELLNQLNKIYKFDCLEREYSPEWISPKRYDNYFILNNKHYILEMDGEFHSTTNKRNGKTAKESKTIDNYKDLKANEHNIEVIRIDCYYSDLEYIKHNILNSKLNELFDLSKINWDKVEEFALSNLAKVACEYKRNNPELTSTNICFIMNLSKTAVLSYLKKGSKLKWCNYDSKEESNRSNKKLGKNAKPVEIFKDGINLGIFKSAHELERQSEKLFGVKLHHCSISLVCNGKKKEYKGYTFKYIF